MKVRTRERTTVEKVKVTVKLPKALVRAGKMYALRHDTHLQDLIERGLRAQLKGGQ